MDVNVRGIRAELEAGSLAPEAAVDKLAGIAHGAPIRAIRVEAFRLLGDIAGRAFDAAWETAEKAAWALLDVARRADAKAERRGLLLAMGRGFRNLWLMPFVHRRLSDDDPEIVAAAIAAAGGLGFAGLEAAVSSRFLGDEVEPALRLAAIAALGRMGAVSAAELLVPFIGGEPRESAAALAALTEIRSPVGVPAATAALDTDPVREVLLAATRYLAELGQMEVLPTLRRLARDEDAALRIAGSLASRAFKAERTRDAGERMLIALTERDRAVRAALSRRLRLIPVAEILEQAEVLLGDEPGGVVQILGEVRTAEVTRFLLDLAGRKSLPDLVRARAVGAVEANEAWEREALAKLIADHAGDPSADAVRAAAVQTMGAFASLGELFSHVGALAADPSPALRGAFLWALQLAAQPEKLELPEQAADKKRCVAALERALGDADASVRRRACYVAGNLGLDALAPGLIALAKAEEAKPELRVAAFVGLGELAAPAVFVDLLALFRREEDPQAVAAASRAVARTLLANPDQKLDLTHLAGKIQHQLKSEDPTVREAAVRLAGLTRGAVGAPALLPLVKDAAPRVREEALTALGRLGAQDAEGALLHALEDADPAIHERAAEALLALGGRRPLERVLAYVSGEGDGAVRAQLAARIQIPAGDGAHFTPIVNAALDRLQASDPAFEALVDLKVALLEAGRPKSNDAVNIDAAITAAFPMYAQLSKVRGFDPLNRSLKSAEALYRTAATLADADLSPPIILWMKCLEGYVHAWLQGRLTALQREPAMLYAYVDGVLGGAWGTYQRWVADRWPDSVDVGATRVDVPLRSVGNVMREFQERRPKRLDSPLSVTEWSRMMVFFAVEHPSGVRNLFKVNSKDADKVVRLAHRLHTLAAVRNVVTHRAAAGASTLEAFRRQYYVAFEDLTKLA